MTTEELLPNSQQDSSNFVKGSIVSGKATADARNGEGAGK
jgi:hypothetical protein